MGTSWKEDDFKLGLVLFNFLEDLIDFDKYSSNDLEFFCKLYCPGNFLVVPGVRAKISFILINPEIL